MVKVKFRCESVKDFGERKEVRLTTVMGGSEENEGFHLYTPSGTLEMIVDNPALDSFFKPGKEFYLDFSEVGEEV